MITRASVRNYRSIRAVDVDLGSLTVLVGRNGAGKSAFVDALRFLRDALAVGPEDALIERHGFGAVRRWTSRGRKPDVEMTVRVDAEGMQGEYGVVLGSRGGEVRVRRERLAYRRAAGGAEQGFLAEAGVMRGLGSGGAEELPKARRANPEGLLLPVYAMLNPGARGLLRHLRDARFYALYPNALREPQRPGGSSLLRERGDNLGTALRALTGPDRDELVGTLNRVAGDVSGVRVRQVAGYLVTELAHGSGQDGTAWFDLSQESDGTVRILGLLTALYQHRGSLLAIEEPELTLHPGALQMLADVLREAATRTQVLLTTQSPDLIARFAVSDLLVVERDQRGTHIGEIAADQRGAVERELFTTGDLLRIEGLRSAR